MDFGTIDENHRDVLILPFFPRTRIDVIALLAETAALCRDSVRRLRKMFSYTGTLSAQFRRVDEVNGNNLVGIRTRAGARAQIIYLKNARVSVSRERAADRGCIERVSSRASVNSARSERRIRAPVEIFSLPRDARRN